jgi:aerobic carbon-monoxide dehydrogenase large subunit
VINAVVDALAALGVTDVGMPATAERVWRAIRDGAQGPHASARTDPARAPHAGSRGAP